MRKNPDELKRDLAAVIESALATVLIDSYLEMQQRYYGGDWKPSELDGGQFCEAVVRALYEVDTGAAPPVGMPVGDMCGQLKKVSPPPTHQLQQKDREHFCRILQSIYNFRNDRGIAHITLTRDHDANLMDATLIVQTVKWLFCEFLRLAQKLDRQEVIATIEAIIQLEHPLIHELDGKPQVMHTGLTVGEEVLLLLQHSPGGRATKAQLHTWIPAKQPAINIAVQRLKDARQVRPSESGEIAITPIGQNRVHQEILPSLAGATAKSAAASDGPRRNTARRKASSSTKRSGKKATPRAAPRKS